MSRIVPGFATIIGGQGFVGSHLFARLQRDGWECWVPEKNDPALLMRPLGHVFYCAGLTADYVQRSFDVIDAHVSLLNQVLHKADYNSLVYLSSTRLYDSASNRVAAESDDLLLNPAEHRHIYDLSKALGESLCHVVGKGKAKIARLSCVYNDADDADGFLSALLRSALAAEPQSSIVVDTSPEYSRDYIGIDDVMRGLIDIVTRGQSVIYNLASGENISNAELFAAIYDKCGVTVRPSSMHQPKEPTSVSIYKLESEFGWRPTSLRQRLPELLKVKTC